MSTNGTSFIFWLYEQQKCGDKNEKYEYHLEYWFGRQGILIIREVLLSQQKNLKPETCVSAIVIFFPI